MLVKTRLKPLYLAGLLLVASACLQLLPIRAAHSQVSDAVVNREMAHLDKIVASDPVLLAMRRVDPNEDERFRQALRAAIKAGASEKELNKINAESVQRFMQKQLKHGSAATLKRYMQFRLRFMERLFALSIDVLYTNLATGNLDVERLIAITGKNYTKEVDELTKGMDAVLLAPPTDTPIRQDNDMVRQRVAAIWSKLTKKELRAINDEGKPDIDRSTYCQAVISLYRETLKLPEAEAVQVFRFMEFLPKDDRLPK